MIGEILAAEKEIELIEEEVVEVEEITVRASQLWEKLYGLLNEAPVHRVVVKNSDGRILFELPLYLGIAGIILLKSWTALGLIVGLLAEVTISVERKQSKSSSKASIASMNDDLQTITGIGPKVNRLLQEAGITTFEQLASTRSDHLRQILTTAGPNYDHIDPASWPEQASRLAIM